MLPGVSGGTLNNGLPSLNTSHPLYTNLIAAYRAIPPLWVTHEVRDLVGRGNGELNVSLLQNCRLHGPEGIIRGTFRRQATSQFPRIPSTIWNYVGSTGFTAAFWARFNSGPFFEAVLDSVGNDFTFAGGNLSADLTRVYVYFNGNPTGAMVLNASLPAGSWNRWMVALDGAGDVKVYANGIEITTGTHGVTPLSLTSNLDICENSGGGGAHLSGAAADFFFWDGQLPASSAMLDFQEALNDWQALMPKRTWQAPTLDQNATASGSIGTITLTAPTGTAFEVNDATASGDIGTITLTAPTATAGGSATASGLIGTIALTAPTGSGLTPDNTASGSIGTIYLQAPTALPYGPPFTSAIQTQHYWGKFSRGMYLHVNWLPLDNPDAVPVVDFWLEGTSIVKTVNLPTLDDEEQVFGYPQLLDSDFTDGNYAAVIRFSSGVADASAIGYFQVAGGSGTGPIISLLEIDRSLGRCVIHGTSTGDVLAGFSPSR